MFSAKIIETSKELTKKQEVMLKQLTDAIKLDKATNYEEDVIIDVDSYAILSVHNDKAEDPDYTTYVIIDKNGQKYTTGSPSFWSAFMDIFEDMAGSGEEWQLKVFKLPSRNREGKDFITCTII